ncbi:hypothetical protein MUK70_15210 [Dyadobacter chenwenxiniae]|uniref:Uncharacterized protein n=1 Tax=Dyadobacter chenwenxiniae TaxID=2906456 RepID=A0A9X1PKR3_9BACT|nr:hypothetical protein [Dyadobacter chenwenxiniae]MCF0060591.1 hypothetical protein [Dyadobacter chenwenxiniae]UON86322.1 hypothetical protein MUK70_15210 [Dyadobacter chenwenxiniae]
MSQKHLYLPKLITGAEISEPTSDALWEDKQRRIITDIGNGIEIDESAQARGVSSIPDIYARPLTFQGALSSEKHPLRDRIVQEWKGLLSLLALHSVKPDLGKLQISPVIFNDEKFCRALVNLAPKPIELQSNGTLYSWTDILIIKFGDIPIGAFSPATMVYTSADYNRKLKDLRGFSLKDSEGYLRPPLKYEGLEYVGKWLEDFLDKFNRIAQTNDTPSQGHAYIGDINKLLADWLKEIKQELGVAQDKIIQSAKVKVAEEMPEAIRRNPPAFLSRYEIYQHILTPLVEGDVDGERNKSDYSLSMSRNKSGYLENKSGYKEVVVITPSLLSQNKTLWDGLTPRELGDDTHSLVSKFFNEESGVFINNINIKNHDSIWIRPELYFLTDTLLKNKTDDDILNTTEAFLNGDETEFILPFKKEILYFFTPEDIQEKLKPRFVKTDEKVVFSFSLPLIDGQRVEIKKTFRTAQSGLQKGEGEIIEVEVPVLEIFPDYLGDFWCQYFMLCSNIDSFKIAPLNFAENIIVSQKEQKIESNQDREKAEIIRISGYNSFPEAVSINSSNRGNNAYGLVLLSKNPDVEGKQFTNKCIVGVDLGTSNTNIYRYTNENAKRWVFSFSKYVRSILNSDPQSAGGNSNQKKEKSKREKITRAFFVPTEDQHLPIPTLLRIFKAGITKDILLDQFIYFPNEPQYPNYVFTDVKWHEDTAGMIAFIRSTIFLVIIDLLQNRVGKIEFRCTYPKSYSDDKVRAVKRAWTESLEKFVHVADEGEKNVPDGKFIWGERRRFDEYEGYYNITTKNNGKIIINTKPSFTTEGIAAGEYFSSDHINNDGTSPANKEDGALCVDVGGGTTDYSIWFNSKIRLDASVKLAGTQIANLLKNNSRVRDLLFTDDSANALNEVKEDSLLFFSRLNFVLRKEEKQIASNLSNNAGNRDIAWLRRILAIEFGALSFYAAHLCLAVDEFLESGLSKRAKENIFKLHWGGNAAKFINWIDYGRYEQDGIASKFLNGIFANTIYDKSIGARGFLPLKLGQIQSPGHKDEASGGIVVMENVPAPDGQSADSPGGLILLEDDFSSKDRLEGVILGERINIGGSKFEHYQVINKNDFFNEARSVFESTELVQLERFVHLINQVGLKTGLFPEGAQINLSLEEKLSIKQRVKNELARQAQRGPDERDVEPIIILEIKYLLDILSHKMK